MVGLHSDTLGRDGVRSEALPASLEAAPSDASFLSSYFLSSVMAGLALAMFVLGNDPEVSKAESRTSAGNETWVIPVVHVHPSPMDTHKLPVPDVLAISGGHLFAKFSNKDGWYRVCHIKDGESWALVDGKSFPFDLPACLDLTKYFIISEKQEDNDTKLVLGVHRSAPKLRLPLQSDADGHVLRVLYNDMWFDVIDESNVPMTTWKKVNLVAIVGTGAVLAGTVATTVGVPAAITAIGFGKGGIVVGTTAAKLMSMSAIGVPALQSIGAAGIGFGTIFTSATVAAATGAGVAHYFVSKLSDDPNSHLGRKGGYEALEEKNGKYYFHHKDGTKIQIITIHANPSSGVPENVFNCSCSHQRAKL